MATMSYLRTQAEKCRRLAREMGDSTTRERLQALAAEYDAQADQLASVPASNSTNATSAQ